MLATSTHDTKRSEDVRARLALLSEIPEKWAEAVRRWSESNERYRKDNLPDRNAEYLFYQTVVGAWPIDAERAAAFMEKAAREAKMHTGWERPDPDYENALKAFVEGVLSDPAFVSDLEAFVTPLIEPGRINALSQTLIKLTAPGVPDLYQGTGLWDLSLVDPDNRRPVDFAFRVDGQGPFPYCLIVLGAIAPLEKKVFVPTLSVNLSIILVLAAVAILVYFIHHVSSAIQADQVFRSVYAELLIKFGKTAAPMLQLQFGCLKYYIQLPCNAAIQSKERQ